MANEKADKEIRIFANGTVELDNCPVSKVHNDKVRWVSDSGPWTITFDAQNQAFNDLRFEIKGNGGKSDWSRDVVGSVGQTCKYTVSGPGGTVDPNIIIR